MTQCSVGFGFVTLQTGYMHKKQITNEKRNERDIFKELYIPHLSKSKLSLSTELNLLIREYFCRCSVFHVKITKNCAVTLSSKPFEPLPPLPSPCSLLQHD